MEKLVVCVMGQDCEKFIGMSLKSVKDAEIVYCDGGSSDNTLDIVKNFFIDNNLSDGTGRIIENKYDQKDKAMNGKQRNFYLEYLKEDYPDYWCLALDADEVVEDLSKIKEFINEYKDGVFSVKMRHLIGDLAHEDATTPHHFVLNRLFKISDVESYPEVEHPVLKPKKDVSPGATNCTTIWHLAYCPNMWSLKKRYENHLAKSNMHTPEYLKNWYYSHLFGTYPKKQFNPVELPKIILEEFGIDKDELYFANRQFMEAKHYQDAIDWKNYFKCENAILFGCGFGQRVKVLNEIGVGCVGIEKSGYAVTHSLDTIVIGDIIDYNLEGKYDLSVAYDLLEHLNYDDLDKAIDTLIKTANKHILISIPFKGTPNCEADPTHIIKEDREWWVKQFTDKGLKEVEVPEHFLFREQLLIFEK